MQSRQSIDFAAGWIKTFGLAFNAFMILVLINFKSPITLGIIHPEILQNLYIGNRKKWKWKLTQNLCCLTFEYIIISYQYQIDNCF